MNKNDNVIAALFVDGPSAEAAIESLREWDKRVGEVKLGSIGKVYYQDGRIETKLVHSPLLKRDFPLSDEAVTTLGNDLSDGRVAVVVTADDFEAGMVADHLRRNGGRVIVNNSERTAEEIAAEQKAVNEAMLENSVETLTERETRPATYNTNRAV